MNAPTPRTPFAPSCLIVVLALATGFSACDKSDAGGSSGELQGACCDNNLGCEISGVSDCEAEGRLFTGAATCDSFKHERRTQG